MLKIYRLFLVILFIFPNAVLAIQKDDLQFIVITNVTVIPMDSERIVENQTVIIKNEKITAIGSARSNSNSEKCGNNQWQGKISDSGAVRYAYPHRTGSGKISDFISCQWRYDS